MTKTTGGGGVIPEQLGGTVRPASPSLTLFMTNICDIPCPIYDLTKNLIYPIMAIAADTVALNVIYDGLLLMKKKLLLKKHT